MTATQALLIYAAISCVLFIWWGYDIVIDPDEQTQEDIDLITPGGGKGAMGLLLFINLIMSLFWPITVVAILAFNVSQHAKK